MWQTTAGNLRIPGWGVVVAFPTALSYTGEGDGTVLRYTAEFTELIASTDREGGHAMWTERKKQIGPIAARERQPLPHRRKIDRAGWPKKWNVPLGQAPFRRGTLKPGGIPDGGAAGKEEHHVD